GCARVRSGRARRVVPGAALARRLPTPVPVRGVVPFTGPHLRADRTHGGGRRRRIRSSGRDRGERMSDVLVRLAVLLRDEGGLMATLLASEAAADPQISPSISSPASVAAEGPRSEGRREEYELL